ncbi:MAG TPA: prepilin-type N-terminal cleavage/methylation domain-containing protein [Caulobacteraceae bacterium]|jgi:prepilin-type N-terminal cleavage/methylation domain-containing protein
MTSRAGFSLIEALVALIIAAMALAGVLELQRQLADGQARYERALLLAGLERNALVLTADLNPTLTPQGSAPLAAGRTISWTSTPKTQPTLNTGSAAAGRRFELRLYRVTLKVLDRDGTAMGELSFDRVGWRKLERAAPYLAPPPPPSALPPPVAESGSPTVGL